MQVQAALSPPKVRATDEHRQSQDGNRKLAQVAEAIIMADQIL
jgi:hypothetical protein